LIFLVLFASRQKEHKKKIEHLDLFGERSEPNQTNNVSVTQIFGRSISYSIFKIFYRKIF